MTLLCHNINHCLVNNANPLINPNRLCVCQPRSELTAITSASWVINCSAFDIAFRICPGLSQQFDFSLFDDSCIRNMFGILKPVLRHTHPGGRRQIEVLCSSTRFPPLPGTANPPSLHICLLERRTPLLTCPKYKYSGC